MIFINLFANIDPSNANRQPYIDALTNLVVVEDPESSTTEHYSSNLSEAVHSSQEKRLVMESLNPTLFKHEEKTFPLINAIYMRNSAININGILRSQHPNTSFWANYLRSNASYDRFAESTLLESALCPNQNDRMTVSYNRRSPNLYFSQTYEAFRHTAELNKKISINNEAHASLLSDQKNLCFIDTFNPCPLQVDDRSTTIKDQHQVFRYLRDFILITLALKAEPDEDTNEVLTRLESVIPSESLYAYTQTRRTDNDTSFSNLNFNRVTNMLLAQSTEELNSQIATIDNSTFNTYIKQNRLGLFNGKEVFSFFSKAFFQKFLHISNKKSVHENASESEILQNIICFDTIPPIGLQMASSISNHRNWSYGDGLSSDPDQSRASILPSQDSNADFIPIGFGTGVTFMHGAQDAYSIKLREHIESLSQSRVVGLISNGFTKRTQKEKFEFVSLTKKQSMIRKGFYIPTLFPIEYRDENFEIQKGYSFSLVCLSSTYDEMCNKTRSREELLNMLSNYQTTDGMYFVDRAQHIALQKEIMKGLIEYSNSLIPSFKDLSSQNLNSLKSVLRAKKKKVEAFLSTVDVDFFDHLSSEPNVSPLIKKKYNKVSTGYNRLSKINAEKISSSFLASANVESQLVAIDAKMAQIESFKQEIAKSEIEITKHLGNLKENFNSRVEVSSTLMLNRELYEAVKIRYESACQKAKDNKDYISNGFFKNLSASNQITIFELILMDKTNSDNEIKYDQDFFDADKKTNFQSFDKNVHKIQNVKFLINSPSIISVDNGAKDSICGGPYVVSVSRATLQIALAYPSSIHGVSNGDILVHPHSSTIRKSSFTTQTQEYQWMSACLGEASSLIYSAFESNNLKTILLAALTWVKSANSTDVWGKRYKFFPKATEINFKTDSSVSPVANEEAINEDEVHDFLEEMIFEDESEIETAPSEEPQAQGFSPDQFAQPVTNYVPAYNQS